MTEATTRTPEVVEVYPCPFCGEAERLNAEGSHVLCINCNAQGPYKPGRGSAHKIAAWNSRLATALEPTDAQPDAGVRGEVERARAIVATELLRDGDHGGAGDVTDGQHDESCIMRAVLAALASAGAVPAGADVNGLRFALNQILRLRPSGNVETCASPRKLVALIEAIARDALTAAPHPTASAGEG